MVHIKNKLHRARVATADEILGHRVNVLDDGYVRLVDYMGSDISIVQAARVSYGEGTKKIRDDEGLIRYLMRHQHTTPFEMCELKLHVRVPMDCWRQWIRHRTANINEYSTRYSIAIDSAQQTAPDDWRLQSHANKQGSSGCLPHEIGSEISQTEHKFLTEARKIYKQRIDAGIAREQARKDLPLSTYTEAYWKSDLHNLFHFLKLRMDLHAQNEIRSYAYAIGHEIVSRWCPIAWQAFLDYQMNSLTLTSREVDVIRLLSRRDFAGAVRVAKSFGWVKNDGRIGRNRERFEAEQKLSDLGLRIPWGHDH